MTDDRPVRVVEQAEGSFGRDGVHGIISVLDAYPDLGKGLSACEFALASRRCRAQVLRLSRGMISGWPLRGAPEKGFQGFLVLGGLLSRRVAMNDLHAAELLGPGDLLRPWPLEDEDVLRQRARWRVHDESDLAVLDRGFQCRAASWPEVCSALHERETERMHSLVTRLLIAQTPRIPHRVNLLLWHLAGRWGRVRTDGVSLPLRLSRTLMAELVCTTRESVSRALSTLAMRGLVECTEDGFLLHDAGWNRRIAPAARA